MNCPNCNRQTPDDAPFCQHCGHALAGSCPACGAAVSPAARFCQHCGQPLAQHAPAPAQAAPATGIPPLAAAERLSASERRIVTILFADVKGSTSIAEQLDPEEWTEIMNGAFAHLIPAIDRFDGLVARLMGDAVLAIFGAPVAHEDDPYRAVLAALDMINDLRPYQNQVRSRLLAAGLTPDPTDFEVRIGINTGLAVVGRVGAGSSGEYTAMGDAVNLAARMEQTAAPGTIQITPETYRHVSPLVVAQPLGASEFKGRREALVTYRVLGLKSASQRLPNVAGFDAPLIGRDREIAQLRTALDNLQAGTGQVVCLVGEAGLGKSRLIQELWAEVQRRGTVDWQIAFSLSFETGQPYGLLQRLLRRLCGCAQDDAPEVVKEKITKLMAQLPPSLRSQAAAVWGSLFSLDLVPGQPPLHGEELKRELFASMYAFWLHQAARRSVILVLDDLHWADRASVELLSHLLAAIREAPLFLLCVFRPNEQAPSWDFKQQAAENCADLFHELTLAPLSAQESDALVNGLLQSTDPPQAVKNLIAAKAEGNPFFAEEIIRELIESGTILPESAGAGWRLAGDVNELEVPESLEAVLIARIDRLPEDARHALQLAAVIGRSFYYRVLALVAANVDRLDQHLQQMEQAGLLQVAAREPELEYRFRHVLTQEAVYNTILLKRRRHFHLRTGMVMETLFADRLGEHAPLLAHHFFQAGDRDRSLRYLIQAGENAARLHANKEAIDYFSRVVALGESGPLDAVTAIEAQRQRGLAYETVGLFELALADFEAVLATARAAGRQRDEWQALLDLGKLWAARNYQASEAYFQQALASARRLDDPVALARSLNRLGNWYVNAERPQDGVSYHKEARAIFDAIDDPRGRAETLDLLGMAALLGGDSDGLERYYGAAVAQFEALSDRKGLISSLTAGMGTAPLYVTCTVRSTATLAEAERAGQRARQLSRDIGWRAGESFACWQLGQVFGATGRMSQAFAAAEDSLAIAREIDHVQWLAAAENVLGFLYLDLLDAAAARTKNELALQYARQVDSRYLISVALAPLARAHMLLGEYDQARTYLDQIATPGTPMVTQGQRINWLMRAKLALHEGDVDEASAIVNGLLAVSTALPAGGVISELWHLRAQILAARADLAGAEQLLLAAIANARQLGEKTVLWRLLAMLGRVYQAQERPEPAGATLTQARRLVDEIAASLPDSDLRQDFVRQAQAQIDSAALN